MRRVSWVIIAVLGAALFLTFTVAVVQSGRLQQLPDVRSGSTVGSAFTYQGYLTDGGGPADGDYDFVFKLYGAESGDNQVGLDVQVDDLPVNDGQFTADLDFEPADETVLDGTVLWLEIGVRPGNDSAPYSTLGPRQRLSPTPYAVYASRTEWSGLLGMPDSFADNLDDDTLGSLSCGSGQIAEWDGLAWKCGQDDVGQGGGGGDITGVHAGQGLIGGGPAGDITLTVAFSGSGSNASVARGDHDHDTTYYSQSDLQTPGSGALVHWSNLDVVPADLADGDNDTVGGLSCDDGEIARWNGTIWACDVDLDTDNDSLGALNCADGQVAKWNDLSGQWACAVDIDTDTDTDTTYSAGLGLSLSGATFSISSTYRLPQFCANDQLISWSGSDWSCTDPGSGGSGWNLTGNAGTVPGSNFLGTTDDRPLELRVNGLRALSLEPNADSPNLVAGYGGNSATGPGATVGGGGRDLAINQANGAYSTIDGGAGNKATGYAASVSGGEGNWAGGNYSTIGGGSSNSAGGNNATVGGGSINVTSASGATIGGGDGNDVTAGYGVVAGGATNLVTGTFGAIGGGLHNIVAGDYGTVAGGGPSEPGNPSTSNNRVYDDYGVVSGGGNNVAGNDDANPTNALAAAVGGGQGNSASASYATTAGGLGNATQAYASTVGGGAANLITATYGAVGGGTSNVVNGSYGAIAGGNSNSAGSRSFVGGGQSNAANGPFSAIGGGYDNEITANYGVIPGGSQNQVGGNYGFAAGRQAQAQHQGSFVWSDSSSGPFASTAQDQFLIQAAGGVGIGTNLTTPTHTLSVGGHAAILSEGRLQARGTFTGSSEFFGQTGKGVQKPSAIDSAGSAIYVTGWATNTLVMIDVSDPDHPDAITYTTSSLQGPVDVQVSAGLAFVACEGNDRLVIVDVSDSAQKFRAIGGSDPRHMAGPQAVHVSGNRAYVAAYGENDSGDRAGLFIFDVSDPTTVLAAGFTDTNLDRPTDVYVAGDHAYVTSRNNDTLAIFDISRPDNILAKGAFSDAILLAGPQAVQVRGKYAYVLAQDSGRLAILDISDPADISLISSKVTSLTRPRALFLSGDYAYVAYAGDGGSYNHSGLSVFDISDPADIQILSITDMSASQPGPEGPVAITGNGRHIYVANENHDSVTIYDINHLTAPAITAGTIQADHLEALGDAQVEHNLSVGDSMHVGPGGALIDGQMAVAGGESNYIIGNLSLGAAGFINEESDFQEIYPTHQLDVHGYSRFRISDEHSLIMASSPEQGALLDFTSNDFGTSYTPTARIYFEVPSPFTHTTEIEILTQSTTDTYMRSRATFGEEIAFYNVAPDLELRTTISLTKNGDIWPGVDDTYNLGDATRRFKAVYAADGVFQTSDGRWKENVADLEAGLAEISQLRPVAFNWIGRPEDGQQYGLIAQEVAKVLPEIVDGDGQSGRPLGMNYAEVVPVLVNAIQEQQAQIERQAGQIAALETRLSAMEDGNTKPAGQASTFLSENLPWLGGLAMVAVVAIAGRRRFGGLS